jgi:hypothetical protein
MIDWKGKEKRAGKLRMEELDMRFYDNAINQCDEDK